MWTNLAPFILFFVLFIILAQFDALGFKLTRRSRLFARFIAVAALVLFAGCRWYDVPLETKAGVWNIFDYSIYEEVYNSDIRISNFWNDYTNSPKYVTAMDIGYVFVSSFFSNYIFDNANYFFLLVSLVTVLLFVKSLRRNQMENVFFLLLFIFVARLYLQYNFIMMRQALAMVIAWCAIPYILERKFIKFLFCCIVAGLFHFTGFLFLVAYMLPKINFSNRFIYISFPILFISSFLGIIDKMLLWMVETLASGVGFGHLVRYLMANEFTPINLFNFLEILPFICFAMLYRAEICSEKNGKLFFNMLIFYTLFMMITMNFMIFTRISSYYIYSFFFIISFIMKKKMVGFNKQIIAYVFIAYFSVYFMRYITSNFFTSYGYNSFLFNL